MEYYLMFTERFFKLKVTNQQNRTDLKYHGEPYLNVLNLKVWIAIWMDTTILSQCGGSPWYQK